MSAAELQEEEREVLKSIYEGDMNYKAISYTVHQYKIGDDGHHQSFVLELKWGDEYPDQLPEISMNAFYNKNILSDIKQSVVAKLTEQAEAFVGCAMTYSLFEWAKENSTELMFEQPELALEVAFGDAFLTKEPVIQEKKPKERKEQLSKSQKRRIIDRIDLKTGERPRGWDWVDIIRHLSQTGSAPK